MNFFLQQQKIVVYHYRTTKIHVARVLNLALADLYLLVVERKYFDIDKQVFDCLLTIYLLLFSFNNYYFLISAQNATANGCFNSDINVISCDHSALDACLC